MKATTMGVRGTAPQKVDAISKQKPGRNIRSRKPCLSPKLLLVLVRLLGYAYIPYLALSATSDYSDVSVLDSTLTAELTWMLNARTRHLFWRALVR